jgi:hypothetical protein
VIWLAVLAGRAWLWSYGLNAVYAVGLIVGAAAGWVAREFAGAYLPQLDAEPGATYGRLVRTTRQQLLDRVAARSQTLRHRQLDTAEIAALDLDDDELEPKVAAA